MKGKKAMAKAHKRGKSFTRQQRESGQGNQAAQPAAQEQPKPAEEVTIADLVAELVDDALDLNLDLSDTEEEGKEFDPEIGDGNILLPSEDEGDVVDVVDDPLKEVAQTVHSAEEINLVNIAGVMVEVNNPPKINVQVERDEGGKVTGIKTTVQEDTTDQDLRIFAGIDPKSTLNDCLGVEKLTPQIVTKIFYLKLEVTKAEEFFKLFKTRASIKKAADMLKESAVMNNVRQRMAKEGEVEKLLQDAGIDITFPDGDAVTPESLSKLLAAANYDMVTMQKRMNELGMQARGILENFEKEKQLAIRQNCEERERKKQAAAEMQQTIEGIANNVKSALQPLIASIKSDQGHLQGSVSNLKDSIFVLKTEMAKVAKSDQVTGLVVTIDKMGSGLSSNLAVIETQLENLYGCVDKLHATIKFSRNLIFGSLAVIIFFLFWLAIGQHNQSLAIEKVQQITSATYQIALEVKELSQ